MRRFSYLAIVVLTLGLVLLPSVKRSARRALLLFVRALLRTRSTRLAPDDQRCLLLVAPHPDDESFGCAGLIARRRLQGLPVHVVCLTDGSASLPGHPALSRPSLAALRRAELQSALDVLMVDPSDITFLGLTDGTLTAFAETEPQSVRKTLAALFKTTDPSVVLLPYRDDGSSEHDAANRLARSALQEAGLSPRVLEYPVWSWWNPLLLLKPLLSSRAIHRCPLKGLHDIQQKAIACHASQLHPIPPWTKAALPEGFAATFRRSAEYFFEQ